MLLPPRVFSERYVISIDSVPSPLRSAMLNKLLCSQWSPVPVRQSESKPLNVCVFQSGVPSRPTWGVHFGFHPGVKEGCPERHHLPAADSWPAGIPTGLWKVFSYHNITSHPVFLFPPLLFSHSQHCLSVTFSSSLPLSTHPCGLLSSICCIVIPFPFRFFFLPCDIFSILRLFVPRAFPFFSLSLSLHHTSFDHLLHSFPSPSLLFMCVPWWSTGAPLSPHNHYEPDLNTGCEWWMEAKSSH